MPTWRSGRYTNSVGFVSLNNTTKNGYILEGWYDSDGVKVVDEKGKILDTDLFNQYLLVHINDDTQTIELHANWIEAVKLTLKATDINGNVNSPATNYEKGTTLTHIDIPAIDTDYTFIGYADSENNIVIDKDGNLNNYVLNEDLILNAIFKVDGYKRVDNFSKNNTYLIVSDKYAMSCETSASVYYRKSILIEKKNDISGEYFIKTDNNNLVWKRLSNNALQSTINSQYLIIKGLYLTTTRYSQPEWIYENSNLKSDNSYVGIDNIGFSHSLSENANIELYEYSNEILVNYYEPTNAGGTE